MSAANARLSLAAFIRPRLFFTPVRRYFACSSPRVGTNKTFAVSLFFARTLVRPCRHFTPVNAYEFRGAWRVVSRNGGDLWSTARRHRIMCEAILGTANARSARSRFTPYRPTRYGERAANVGYWAFRCSAAVLFFALLLCSYVAHV